MRKKIIMGNWKMNYTTLQAEEFVTSIKDRINTDEVDVVICPNFVSLETVSNIIDGTHVKLGAQNVATEEKGAYTGETSAEMLLGVNVTYCIVGHSERRTLYQETDQMVNQKVKKLLEKDITPVICCGETLEQREKEQQEEVIKQQLTEDLKGLSASQVEKIVIAYEPIWAIGTGKTATPEQAETMCAYIRHILETLYTKEVAQKVRIQYGGSVKPSTVTEILNKENIDGVLVGGASLTEDFVAIVHGA